MAEADTKTDLPIRPRKQSRASGALRSEAQFPEAALPDTPDPIEIAMVAQASGVAPNGIAADLLRRQARLIDMQSREIAWRRSLWMLLWGLAAALVLVLAGSAVNASRSRAIVVEPFRVPQAMARQGIDGTVVANRLLDAVARLRDDSQSVRAWSDIGGGWDGDIRIMIPNTGVSIGEVMRYLRIWFSNDRRLGGDVVESAGGITVTVRMAGESGESFAGSRAELDALLAKAALSIFANSQPYRYAASVDDERAVTHFQKLALGGDVKERRWGFVGWATQAGRKGQNELALELSRRAVATDSKFAKARINVSSDALLLGRFEEALAEARRARADMGDGSYSGLSPMGTQHMLYAADQNEALLLHDVAGETAVYRKWLEMPEYSGNVAFSRVLLMGALARAGELSAARQMNGDVVALGNQIALAGPLSEVAEVQGDMATAARLAIVVLNSPNNYGLASSNQRAGTARLLVAAGRVDEADVLLGPTKADCYPCLVERGGVAAARGDAAGAARWFAAARTQGPSFADADYAEARMLIARGRHPQALARLDAALTKAKNWPLLYRARGDSLLALGRAEAAAGAYRDGTRLVPKMASMRLALGNAQWRLGNRQAAITDWLAGAGLDLTKADRATLRAAAGELRRAARPVRPI